MGTKICKICGMKFIAHTRSSLLALGLGQHCDFFKTGGDVYPYEIYRRDRCGIKEYEEKKKINADRRREYSLNRVACEVEGTILMELCASHLKDFFSWGERKFYRVNPRIYWYATKDEITEYIGWRIKTIIWQINDDRPTGFCEVLKKSDGTRCIKLASKIVNGHKICGTHAMHMLEKGIHHKFVNGINRQSPIEKAAHQLLFEG